MTCIVNAVQLHTALHFDALIVLEANSVRYAAPYGTSLLSV